MHTVFRVTAAKYAGDLSGEGARLAGGRWNGRGTPALYTAGHVSLGILETLVHVVSFANLPKAYSVTVVECSETVVEEVAELPASKAAAQRIGQSHLQRTDCLGFWSPSVIVPTERNLVLNPRCERYASVVKVVDAFEWSVDARLRGSS